MGDAPRILVVDDEPKICTLLKKLLSREGYEVETHPDGPSALKGMLRSRPDLLISDIRMPEMDGLELARRAHSLDPELPVVLVTGYASMETAVLALRQGVSDYITKPFSIDELKTVVGRILENRTLAAENRRLARELTVANAELTQHRHRLTLRLKEAESDLVSANHSLEKRLRELEVIHEISQMVANVVDTGELLALATQLVRDKVGVRAAVVLDSEAEGLAGHVLATGDAVFLDRADDDARATAADLERFGAGSLLAVPIRAKGGVAGVLVVGRGEGGIPPEERELVGLIANDLSVAVENAHLFEENERAYIEVLSALVTSMEARDPYLRQHSERVKMKARDLGQALGLSRADLDVLTTGARLHDLGKVGIPDRILHKPGPLTEEEMDVMRSHPVIGDQIVKPLGRLKAAKRIIRNHHERWDGGGYPDGLAGEEIPLAVRIVTIADAFDALTSRRSYRDALPREEALRLVEMGTGSHFSPVVAEVFVERERSRAVRHGRRKAAVGEAP